MYIKGKNYQFNIIGRRRYWFAISLAIILISVALITFLGLNFGIEFMGGTVIRLQMEHEVTAQEVRDIITASELKGTEDSIVQIIEGDKLVIRTAYMEHANSQKLISQIDESLGVKEILEIDDVGAGWGREISKQALISLIVFLIVILLYISFRFEFKMAIAAILALFHDMLLTIGVFALTGRQITPATVIAFLTILGYSLYDSVVIFDRIKENADVSSRSKLSYSDITNNAINQTLTRSLGTSVSTLLPIATILLFGGETLKDFAFALFVGVIVGTYSSIFVAPAFLSFWKDKEPRYAVAKTTHKSGAKEKVLKSKDDILPVDDVIEEVPAETVRIKADKESAVAVKPKASPKTTKGGSKKPAAKRKTTAGPRSKKKKKKKK